MSIDSFNVKSALRVGDTTFTWFSLPKLAAATGKDVNRLPLSLRVLLENLLRFEDNRSVNKADILALLDWDPKAEPDREIAFRPARTVLQDFTGVPCVVDLATMREAIADMGGDPQKVNPLTPVDLVIDHSVQVDAFGTADSFDTNVRLEYERNKERYAFLRWGQQALANFRVVPPGTGIVHQVNLEYLAKCVFDQKTDAETLAYPDTLVGTDSHTTMINGLGVLGWGVGGIEAEAAMLGQPISMLIPQVVGFKLTGTLPEGATATDLVLRVVEMLRKQGVVGKFVEFFGPGLDHLSLADRATIANMAPEYGATMGFFPVDDETINYLNFTGRDEARCELVREYMKAQGMYRTKDAPEAEFSALLELDLGEVLPALAGPKRPQDRLALGDATKLFFDQHLPSIRNTTAKPVKVAGQDYEVSDGSIVIAAITSCTNTSNPAVLVAAGLVAKKAHELGLNRKPWVKTSLAPGSQVVTDYLKKAGLMQHLEAMGFNLVGYGCTTCIGNSGPLPEAISKAIADGGLVACSVLSGNRNFEGRISPDVRANYLASPPLVVAYALAGHFNIDITTQPIGEGTKGPVYLKDIWPSNAEIRETMAACLDSSMFKERYGSVFDGDQNWSSMPTPKGDTFKWEDDSTYIRKPTFFEGMAADPAPVTDITGARVLAKLGDSVTTDHISPAGSIKPSSPAGKYLQEHNVNPADFNSYGSRRGNHEVMMRGTFANIRIRNMLVPGVEGGVTRYLPTNEQMSIYDAAMAYKNDDTPLIILAGAEYGTGSSRDWAAKGTVLLGVKAVIAKSFERIHRSNLIGMGVIPLQYKEGQDAESLGLSGEESFELKGIAAASAPAFDVQVTATNSNGDKKSFLVRSRIDTPDELSYYQHGGILQYVLRQMKADA